MKENRRMLAKERKRKNGDFRDKIKYKYFKEQDTQNRPGVKHWTLVF